MSMYTDSAKSYIITAWLSEADCSATFGADQRLAAEPQPHTKPRKRKRRPVSLEFESSAEEYTMDNSPKRQSVRLKRTQVEAPLRSEAPRSSSASSRYVDALGDAGTTGGIALTPETTLDHPSESGRSGRKSAKSARSRPPSPRSRSPARCVHDLQQASPPTEQVTLEEAVEAEIIPKSVEEIEDNVQYALRYDIFPESIKV